VRHARPDVVAFERAVIQLPEVVYSHHVTGNFDYLLQQLAVDRRFTATFGARLKDALDLDSLRDDLAQVIHQTLAPAHISVWSAAPGRVLDRVDN
jgi:hypothetical protein